MKKWITVSCEGLVSDAKMTYWLNCDKNKPYGPSWEYAENQATRFMEYADIPFIVRQMEDLPQLNIWEVTQTEERPPPRKG